MVSNKSVSHVEFKTAVIIEPTTKKCLEISPMLMEEEPNARTLDIGWSAS